MKRRKRMGMWKARLVSSRANIDAGSPIPFDITEPLWDQARSIMERERQLAAKQQRLLEQASRQSAVSTPEKLVALLDRIAEARARSANEGQQTARKPGF